MSRQTSATLAKYKILRDSSIAFGYKTFVVLVATPFKNPFSCTDARNCSTVILYVVLCSQWFDYRNQMLHNFQLSTNQTVMASASPACLYEYSWRTLLKWFNFVKGTPTFRNAATTFNTKHFVTVVKSLTGCVSWAMSCSWSFFSAQGHFAWWY